MSKSGGDVTRRAPGIAEEEGQDAAGGPGDGGMWNKNDIDSRETPKCETKNDGVT